jgi:hypothetical protein
MGNAVVGLGSGEHHHDVISEAVSEAFYNSLQTIDDLLSAEQKP